MKEIRIKPQSGSDPRVSIPLQAGERYRIIIPSKAQKLTVKVVDEQGQPLADVPVSFKHGNTTLPATTEADGVASCEFPGSSTAHVVFADIDALANGMKEVWSQCRGVNRTDWISSADGTTAVTIYGGKVMKAETKPPSAGLGTPRVILSDFEGVETSVTKPATLSVQPLVILVRLLGRLFDTDKCFLLPAALHGVQELVRLRKEYEQTDVLIVGHTDTSAAQDYNVDLSLERTSAMRAYLLDDADSWLAWYGQDKQYSKRWGTTEDTAMIGTLLAGTAYPPTVLGYQQWHNAEATQAGGYAALTEDGEIGPLTRKQLILDYMHREDTTVPPDTLIEAHGCGEYFPLDATGEHLDAAAADGQHEQEDRRVEVFLFPKELGILPVVPGKKAKKAEKEYPEWRHRSAEARFVPSGPHLVLGWREDLVSRLPPGTALSFTCTGLAPQSFDMTDGEKEDGLVKFTFNLNPSRGPCTLVAQASDKKVSLWETQTIKDNGSPFRWTGALSDLVADDDGVDAFTFES
jgi:outer membrane protein OmpA-like peptidoglycan-associated protein